MNDEDQQWLQPMALIGQTNSKSDPIGRNRSMVARTSMCGWVVSDIKCHKRSKHITGHNIELIPTLQTLGNSIEDVHHLLAHR